MVQRIPQPVEVLAPPEATLPISNQPPAFDDHTNENVESVSRLRRFRYLRWLVRLVNDRLDLGIGSVRFFQLLVVRCPW
jgi:hypothetical protein